MAAQIPSSPQPSPPPFLRERETVFSFCISRVKSVVSTIIQKGYLTGTIIGENGTKLFTAFGISKGMDEANKSLALEKMLDKGKKAMLPEEAAKSVKNSEQILKKTNLTIQWDRQGKHIKGHKNFDRNTPRSILTHKEPQRLVNEFAGTGRKKGSKEVVNFKDEIGYIIDQDTGNITFTTCGKIHYAKDGTHIVPTKPKENL
jgi:hypothetical protein